MTKNQLRKHIKQLMREYSPKQLEALSLPIIEQLLSHPKVLSSQSIILFHSLPDEVFTHSLINTLYSQGKRVLLPKVVSPTEMTLHEYRGADSLSPGAFGILEPNNEATVKVNAPLAIIPGVAFDKDGNRLGRGKGYYDRLLPNLMPIYKIGVCFPFQILDTIPHSLHDISMDEIIL